MEDIKIKNTKSIQEAINTICGETEEISHAIKLLQEQLRRRNFIIGSLEHLIESDSMDYETFLTIVQKHEFNPIFKENMGTKKILPDLSGIK